MISQYWVNQIPARPLSILVKNEQGLDFDLSAYPNVKARLVGSDNEEIDLTGSSINSSNKDLGKIIFFWPTTRSLFAKKGDYVFQLEFYGTDRKDYTSTHTIRVRELGKANR